MADTSARRIPKPLLIGIHVLGALLLFGIAAIHLDLYLTSYKYIPTVGELFLVQIIAAALVGLATLVFRHRLVALGGALLALGTLVGYELFRATTLFGFHEIPTNWGLVAGILEAGAFAALLTYAVFSPSASGADTAAGGALGKAVDALSKPPTFVAGAVVTVAMLALVGLTAVPGSTPKTTSTVTGPAGLQVVIQNFAFHPADFTVTPGEVISVTNKDGVAHTFTSNPGGAFDTGPIAPGSTVEVKVPTTPGQYPYECTIHTFMTGILTVS